MKFLNTLSAYSPSLYANLHDFVAKASDTDFHDLWWSLSELLINDSIWSPDVEKVLKRLKKIRLELFETGSNHLPNSDSREGVNMLHSCIEKVDMELEKIELMLRYTLMDLSFS